MKDCVQQRCKGYLFIWLLRQGNFYWYMYCFLNLHRYSCDVICQYYFPSSWLTCPRSWVPSDRFISSAAVIWNNHTCHPGRPPPAFTEHSWMRLTRPFKLEHIMLTWINEFVYADQGPGVPNTNDDSRDKADNGFQERGSLGDGRQIKISCWVELNYSEAFLHFRGDALFCVVQSEESRSSQPFAT